MSRSKRKTPIFGYTTAENEKWDKRKANRRFRKETKQSIKKNSEVMPLMRQVSNVWGFAKDGKRYVVNDWSQEDIKKEIRK